MTENYANDRPVICFDIIGNASKVRLSDAIRHFATASLPDSTPISPGPNIEYTTENAFFKCILIPDHTEYITWKLNTDVETDAAVCVVSARTDDLNDVINELILAAAYGRVLVFIDTDGSDEKRTDALEERIRDTLNAIWCRGDALVFFRGSLMDAFTSYDAGTDPSAPIARLVAALETPSDRLKLLSSRPFLMRVDDCFTITGRGLVASGKTLRGELAINSKVDICGLAKEPTPSMITDMVMFHKHLEITSAGDHIGALLRGLQKDAICPGQLLAQPGTMHTHQNFSCEIVMLPTEQRGRKTPFNNGYTPQFYIHKADISGIISLPEGIESVAPGETTQADVALRAPVALEPGIRFALREGGRVLGQGYVTQIIETTSSYDET